MQNEQWQPLLMEGVKGEVFTMTLFKNVVYTSGRIKLMPYSMIPFHLHETDEEEYWDEETGECIDFCPKGKGHCFINNTDHIKYLRFIKKAA